MSRLTEELQANTYRNVYLFFGDEAFNRNSYKNYLVRKLVAEGDNLNYSYFEGSKTDMSEVIGLMETMPFMADHRVIVVENSGWFAKGSSDDESNEGKRKGKESDGLLSAIENISEDVVVIFSEEKADQRSKLFKAISKAGICENCEKLTPEAASMQVARFAKKEGKLIRSSTAEYLVNEVGCDLYTLYMEVNKLACWCLERDEITISDIDEVCTHQVNNKIFDMVSAIGNHRQKEALKLYYDLLTLRESPFHILTLITRQYNQMLEVKSLLNAEFGPRAIAEKLGSPDWLVKKISASVSGFSKKKIKRCLEACAKADEDIKSGNISDALSIELLIIECSQADN
ncbi:MAG: DNA polymerase III subunit delta [Lachnospiraceae bacterium]|nr:DNA polymerase III subunit delta [Lachnospiraceae bacterium]